MITKWNLSMYFLRIIFVIIITSLSFSNNVYAEDHNLKIKEYFGYMPGNTFEYHDDKRLNIDQLPEDHDVNLLFHYAIPVFSEELSKYFTDFDINIFNTTDKIARISADHVYESMDICKQNANEIYNLLSDSFPEKEGQADNRLNDDDCPESGNTSEVKTKENDKDSYYTFSFTPDKSISMKITCDKQWEYEYPFLTLNLNIVHVETQNEVDKAFNKGFENIMKDFANGTPQSDVH